MTCLLQHFLAYNSLGTPILETLIGIPGMTPDISSGVDKGEELKIHHLRPRRFDVLGLHS